jgi:ABC-type transport system involved in multi-copper enzyme maturation permease subunit
VSWSGLSTVTRLELRQRVRSTRWIIVLVVWALVLGGLTAMIHYAIVGRVSGTAEGAQATAEAGAGSMSFALIVLLVLSLGSLIAPALSATSVNGDRSAGVLATMQTTLLTPAEIALGKLAASWITSMALLAVALPFIGWGYLDGGTPPGRLIVTLTLLAVTLLVVCAVGLGWSAITARTTSSAVLTYLTVAAVGIGLPVLFLLLLPINTTHETVRVREPADAIAPMNPTDTVTPGAQAGACVEVQQQMDVVHTERIWWVLAANPYVVIADASPKPAKIQMQDALSGIRAAVREARLGEPAVQDYCNSDAISQAEAAARSARRESLGVTWPYGLAADLALGVGFTVVTVRRLRTPTRALPRGTRVA